MLNWLTFFNNILKLGERIASFFRERWLRKQGYDEAMGEIKDEANKKLDAALDARRNVKHDDAVIKNDPDNRNSR